MRQPFRLNAVRLDLSEGDCVTFVERTIAMSLARDWQSYRVLYDRLCHKDGVVEYRNRNFSTLGDFLPNNSWLLRDISAELGPAQSFTHVVRPKVFEEFPAAPGSKFMRIVFKGSDYTSADKEVRTNFYIPRGRVTDVLPALHTGDVVLVIRDSAGGHCGCDHLGLIARGDNGIVNLVHSAPPRARQQDILDFLRRFQHVKGFMFLRLRDDARLQVDAEVARLAPTLSIPEADKEDERVQKLRARRLANTGTGAN